MDIKGHTVEIVWIEAASDIAEEYYASFTLDRSAKKHLGMLSAQGGVEIEEVADTDPDAIAKIYVEPGRGPQRGRRPGLGRGREAEPRRHRGRGRHPAQALHGLHRRRCRPGRDQPAHPHPGRPGPRPGRQGHPGRQRRVPPRVGRVRGHPGARRAGAGGPRQGPAVRRPRRHGRHHRQRCRPGHEHRRRRQPGRRQPGQLPRHRGRGQRRRDGRRPRGHQQRREGAGPSSSTSSGASPGAKRWPTASCRRWVGWTSAPRSSSAWTAPTPRRGGPSWPSTPPRT